MAEKKKAEPKKETKKPEGEQHEEDAKKDFDACVKAQAKADKETK